MSPNIPLSARADSRRKRDDTVIVNIGFEDFLTQSLVAHGFGVQVIHQYSNFNAAAIEVDPDNIETIRDRDSVRYVEFDETASIPPQHTGLATPDDLDEDPCIPWGVDRIDAEVAHDAGYTGAGADIAIVDTGIDATHPGFDNVGEGVAFAECEDEDKPDWHDDHYHGTHCAGSAAASDNGVGPVGVAPDATLHAVKVLDNRGRGRFSDIAAGVETVADKGWDIASLSLGGPESEVMKDALDYAADEGVAVIVSAGNSGPCTDCISSPADHPEAICVAATSDDDTLARFSSTGPEMNVAAPGEDVYSTIPDGYRDLSGTSMACPHKSGVTGLLVGAGFEPRAGAAMALDATETIGLADNESGSGFLDAAATFDLDSSDDGTGDC